jgi:choline dehydrogenase
MKPAFDADVIVVGAGSAGSVVAGTLARDPARRVLLIEAGPRDWNPLLRVPLMTGVLLRGRYANWFYHSEPEPGLNGRSLFWPRGKVLGGSSAINGMVWTRGAPDDYNGWAQRGLPDWTWDRVLARYKALESYWAGPNDWHGGDGPQPLTRLAGLHPLSHAFLEAGQQAGHAICADFNAPGAAGVGQYDFCIKEGRRVSAATSFLKSRPNLTVLTDAHVLRVIVEGTRAIGVEVLVKGERLFCGADETVLSGGTVNTPQVMMLSGLGPAEALRAHGIAVVRDLPGVGRNLRDHLLVRVEHDCTEPVTMHGLLRPDRAALALARALTTGTGPAARFPLEVGAYLRSDPTRDMADLQSHFLPGLSTAAVRWPWKARDPKAGHGFFANVYQLRPESTGEIALRSADPLAAPVIRGNYLSDPGDLVVLRAGVRALRDIFRQPAFARWRGAERSPGAARQTDADLDLWIRATADTVFHPVGTCRMGQDTLAITDSRLRVHGIDGLRIADASVMPTMPGCNTHAPSMLIGAQCAAFIAGERHEEAAA